MRDGVKVTSFVSVITYSKPCLSKPGVLEGTDGVCDKRVRHQACSAFLRADRADMCPDHRVSTWTGCKRLSGSFGSSLWELPQNHPSEEILALNMCPFALGNIPQSFEYSQWLYLKLHLSHMEVTVHISPVVLKITNGTTSTSKLTPNVSAMKAVLFWTGDIISRTSLQQWLGNSDSRMAAAVSRK